MRLTKSDNTSSSPTTDLSKASGLWQRCLRALEARYLWSVGAQGLVSGFHFALNLVLVRMVTQEDFGIYAFAFVLAMFASAINNALIATPLTVWTPVINDQDERRDSEAMFSTLNTLLFLVLGAIGCLYAFVTTEPGEARLTVLGVTAFAALYAARQYSRTTGYARMRPLVPAAGDICYVITGSLLVAIMLWHDGMPPIGMILLALAAANASAMLVEQTYLNRRLQWPTGFSGFGALGHYRDIWKAARWALIGSMTTLFLAQAHSLIVTWQVGPDAFAPLAAGFVLFGPVRIALLTWQNMVKPELAVALSEGRAQAVRSQLKRTTLITAVAVIILGVVIFLGWGHVHEFLYAKRYADSPMGLIVCLWAATTFFAASYNAPSAALQALKDFRLLAMASIYGAILSGSLVVILLWQFGAVHTLYGVLAAEIFMAVWLMRLLNQRLEQRVSVAGLELPRVSPA